jgi:3-phosphoshikimate 1-carboxyvinyltransferase
VTYLDKLEIIPLSKPPVATIRVPGSKSITNRALVLAALATPNGGCELQGVLRSEDTEVMVEALQKLGFQVQTNWTDSTIRVFAGHERRLIPADKADLFVGNSGTTMRFLTALVALGNGHYRLDGVLRMRERPMEDLLDALRQLGVHAYSETNRGYPPIIVEANGLKGGRVQIKADVSSQFLSGLLMVAPCAQSKVTISIKGSLVSEPYVAMTRVMMKEFGAQIETDSTSYFCVPAPQTYQAGRYQIEPDASAASYFFGAAAILQGKVSVADLPVGGTCDGAVFTNPSIQGDIRFLAVLQKMGCQFSYEEGAATLQGRRIHGIEIDMNAISDTVMTLAAVACFAEGPTTIRNVAHIRHKETDRLAALATELRKVGADVVEFNDGLTITPRPLHGAEIETYDDHRMAMSMALVGLKVPGVVIKNPGCVAKTYPGFWQDLEKLRS